LYIDLHVTKTNTTMAQAIVLFLYVFGLGFLAFLITRVVVLWYFEIPVFKKLITAQLEEMRTINETLRDQLEMQRLMYAEQQRQKEALQELILLQSPQSTGQV